MPVIKKGVELRAEHLEGVTRWISQALEIGSSLNDSYIRVGVENAELGIFKEVMYALKHLFDFEAMSFLLVDELSHDFVISASHPSSYEEVLQEEIDHHIDQGSFSWALNQSRAYVTKRRDGEGYVVLHVLSTRSRIRGMFIALHRQDINEVNDLSMNYLSMLLLGVSNNLESHELYRYVNDQNHNLEKIVKQRTSELEEARQQAEEASSAKSSFLANMSHEIRTPLTSVIGYAEWLKDDNLPEYERNEAINAILRTGKHLMEVINDILDLSKIESNNLEVEIIKVHLDTLISEVVRLMSMHAMDKGLVFKLDYKFPLPRYLMTDPTRLKQILINLCNNAIKFTEHGFVRLVVSCSAESGSLSFSVEDSGIGIKDEKIDKLFNSFTQADVSTTRRFGGTGLGLNISRRLAIMLGGNVSVSSIFGEGSSFIATVLTDKVVFDDLVYELNDMQGDSSKLSDENVINESALKGKVLLAEDNIDNQRLISHTLRRLGVEVSIVDNGELAVECALAEEFDLVLMDMQMPLMDGPEATEMLRLAGSAVPIIALTANIGQEDRERCLNAGCNDFLCKPIDRQEFYTVISQYLKKEGEIQNSADNEDLMKELREKYIVLLCERQQEIISAYSNNDRDYLKSSMHQIKGSAGGYGYPALGQMAAAVEALLKTDIDADINVEIEYFFHECQRIVNLFDNVNV